MLALAVALLCVFANGFFVAAEFALAKVRPTALDALAVAGDKKAERALELTRKLDAYLAATQLGITLASLTLGWIGEPAIARLLGPVLLEFGLSADAVHAISLTVAFSIITALHIIVGELIPKSLAIQRPEDVSRHTARPMKLFYVLVWPALWVLNGLSNFALRRLGLPPSEHAEGKLSVEELRIIVRASFQGAEQERRKREILERVLRGYDLPVRAIMVPRVDMITLALSDGTERCLEVARQYGYSRYPVSEDGQPDKIAGYLYVKDLLMVPGRETEDLRARKRDLLFVPPTRTVGDVLADFQRTAIPIAIVVDEFGGTAGLVTLEDAVEAIVGELKDELDKEAPPLQLRDDGAIVVDGAIAVHELQVKGYDLGVADVGETVGGRILSALGRMAHPGDRVNLGAYEAFVEDVRRRRISRVLLRPRVPTERPEPVRDSARIALSEE